MMEHEKSLFHGWTSCSMNFHFLTYERNILVVTLFLQRRMTIISCNNTSNVGHVIPLLFFLLHTSDLFFFILTEINVCCTVKYIFWSTLDGFSIILTS